MPLRSVEAATRDDAIAAAREQFGPQARVVGVRRVRSGGVLGFFATERYVAEVAPDAARPPVPSPARGSSPLASASPATAAPSRATAPARNGAAVYAAEAGRAPAARPAAEPVVRPATARPVTTRPAEPPVDDARVSELVGLLGAAPRSRDDDRPAFARPGYQRATFPKATWTAPAMDDEDDDEAEPAPVLPTSSAAPSPFTAALARMVAGDRDVRQAVEEAVEEAMDQPAVVRSRSGTEPRPLRSAPVRSAETAVWPRAARQEEETVGDQVIAPPSMPAAPLVEAPVEVPTWAAEPETVATPDSSREEAIAEILRSALAQGHSDEALAGILRKVLDGASPQAALTEPELPVVVPELVMADNVVAEQVTESFDVPEVEPVAETVVEPAAVAEAPVVAERVVAPVVQHLAEPFAAPVTSTFTPTVTPSFTAHTPMFAPLPAPAVDIWGTTVSTPLWGEAVTPARVVPADAPIWAEVVLAEPRTTTAEVEEPAEPVVEASPGPVIQTAAEPVIDAAADAPETVSEVVIAEEVVAESVATETAVEDTVVAETAVEDTVVAETVAETEVETEVEIVTETVVETIEAEATSEVLAADVEEENEVAEVAVMEMAPVLARTASDPAPFALSMSTSDATTVMPPLSLLPPLPSSRGRGRPPVPPASSRRAASPERPSAPAPPAAPPAAEEPEPAAPAPTVAPTIFTSLATVTRLPVAPLMASPEIPELSEQEIERLENAALDAPVVESPKIESRRAETPKPEVTTEVAVPAAVAVAEPIAEPVVEPVVEPAPMPRAVPGDVVSRLAALGLPTRFLGAGFAADVDAFGTYAALTRALGLRLPAAPELPSGAGEVLFVVGPGVETLRAARSLAATLRLGPDRVQWATRGDLAGLAPEGSRMTTIDAAISRRQDAATAGTVTIVAVDAPMRTDAYWMAKMLAIWSPAAVWAVVEATRKPEDLGPWLDDLARVDALIVTDTDLSADPAAVLHRVAAPVALLDGVRATPHRWASLLCERLEGSQE